MILNYLSAFEWNNWPLIYVDFMLNCYADIDSRLLFISHSMIEWKDFFSASTNNIVQKTSLTLVPSSTNALNNNDYYKN